MAQPQVRKSEQISSDLTLSIDYDQPITDRNKVLEVLTRFLGNGCEQYRYKPRKLLYKYEHDGIIEYFLLGAVTYLSHPHPVYKKRFQLKTWYKDFYSEHKDDPNTKIRLIGLYHYEDLFVFVDFNIEDYIGNRINSSAAHVFTNDIFQAVKNDIFKKTDSRGNRVTSIIGSKFSDFLNGTLAGNDVFGLLKQFNDSFPFGEWIKADDSISEMKQKNWYQWRGTEWPGWLLESRFDDFIRLKNCKNQLEYVGNIKSGDKLDFDLIFKDGNFYGDIKSSDISKREMPGNDKSNVIQAIQQYGKLWIVLYEHETIKDKDRGNEMAIARMSLIGEVYHPGEKISYKSRMKHSVKYTRMRVFELNQINMNRVLANFKQGRQQSGASRKAKFKIKKREIDNYIIFAYDWV